MSGYVYQQGTLQSCCNHWTGRILKHYSYPRKLGRWTGHQYRLKDNKTLSVIAAYRPCYQSLTNLKLESITVSNQQVILLQEDGITNPNPRAIFIEDMIKVLYDIENSEDNYIILMFDANEDINDREKGLRKIVEKTSLVDSFVEISGSNIKLATYAKGQKRLDYMLTSSNLLPFIENIGYTPFYSINTSDHRGVFMDISSCIIDNKVELSRPPTRNIGTKSKPEDIYKYKAEIHKQFVKHRIYDRSQHLWLESLTDTCSKTLESKLNQLDKQITEIMLSTEKQKCSRRHESEWSIELHTTSLICKYWTKQFKGLINGILVTKQIKTIWHKLPLDKKNEINSKILQDQSNQALMKISKTNMIFYLAYKGELIRHAKSLRLKGLLNLKEIRTAEGKNAEAAIIGKIGQ